MTPENQKHFSDSLSRFNVGDDWLLSKIDIENTLKYVYSPVFDGLYDFCSIYTGASLQAAAKLNENVRTKMQNRLLVTKITFTAMRHSD